MAYSIQWGQKSPGHIIFLIDQSGSMSGDNEIKAAEAVHKAIEEIINNCINGTKVKNRVYITIIGYGNENDVCILKEGWATDYVMDLQKCKSNGTLIVEPDSYGGTPMAEAAKERGIEGVCAGAKCMAVNAKGATITALICFGSGSGMTKH